MNEDRWLEDRVLLHDVLAMLSALRGWFRFLRGERYLDADPTAAIDGPRLARPLPVVMTVADVDRVLAAPDRSEPRGLRDAAMIERWNAWLAAK